MKKKITTAEAVGACQAAFRAKLDRGEAYNDQEGTDSAAYSTLVQAERGWEHYHNVQARSRATFGE